MKKDNNPTVKDAIPEGVALQWETMPGLIFTISYQAVGNKWPILFHQDGKTIEIEKEDFELIVANFVSDSGLTQATLWDTYRECDRDVAFSRIRRDG